MYIKKYDSPLGEMILCDKDGALCGVWFTGQRYEDKEARTFPEKDTSCLLRACKWLDAYFTVIPLPPTPPLALDGTEFSRTVLTILREIPYGETKTYKEIAAETARRLGKEKMSSQAVGNAVGHNKISIFIPCHRVIGSDGSLTGYAGGLERKKFLLNLEKKGISHADNQ